MDIVVLIPSYEPTYDFIEIIKNMRKSFDNIVVVDDGSNESYRAIFDKIEDMGVPVLRHAVNLGKGRALKTGFNYIANTYGHSCGIVTADSDGQHTAEDISKVAQSLQKHPDELILGSRDFDQDHVPWKSMFGNKMTRIVLSFFCGVKVSDTQTGLRGLSIKNALKFMNVSGERFDFETNMLIETKKFDLPIIEETIKTIYLEENKGTHFNPIKDSLQIYKMFAKYMLISLSSFLVDIILFTLFLSLLSSMQMDNQIILATIAARVISSFFNYFMNCKSVFQKNASITTVIKYYILVIIQMLVSGFSVQFLNTLCPLYLNVVFIKLIIDTILFAMNFYIQREWIFKVKEQSL